MTLTARETQTLQLTSDGLSCREIGRQLEISEATVRKHRSNMFAKLGCRNAAQLVALARMRGWLTCTRRLSFRRALGTGTGGNAPRR
ncbi:LuxR C-terminal-related transcriptional regulator [Mitsuaria sp. 7]|uniref:response regulator transcription factor n=1 Tax=Mitsuaria sp. 7 TaxID=1658665 RepID=UPI0009ECD6DA